MGYVLNARLTSMLLMLGGPSIFFLCWYQCSTDNLVFVCVFRGGSIQESGVVLCSADEEVSMPVLDESQPTTTLQIRLRDGRRIRQQFNTSHTLQHVQVSSSIFAFVRPLREKHNGLV